MLTATLTVTDSEGETASDQARVTVQAEDLLQLSGMLADRLATLERGTSVQREGDWIVLSTRGIERRM